KSVLKAILGYHSARSVPSPMVDQKQWAIAWSRFQAFREHLLASINEDCVNQYHSLIADLESASGESFEKFKVPDEKLSKRVVQVRMRSYSGRPGGATLSKDRYCDSSYFHAQVDGLHSYLESTIAVPSKPKVGARQGVPAAIHVENMYGSNIQHGSPGATA